MIEPTRPAGLLLPEGSRLLHIGPPGTGAASLQAALRAVRPALLEQGVMDACSLPHAARADPATAGRPAFSRRDRQPPIGRWSELVREIRAVPEPRVVLSSEELADATPEAIVRVVDDLDRERVHVVVTLRPLAEILCCEWQQRVQSGLRDSYDAWLEAILDRVVDAREPSFWHRQCHDELVARWAAVVGPQRLTVVATDDQYPGVVAGAFEGLLGLRAGTLVVEPDVADRSFTLPEIEAVRALAAAFAAEGLPGRQFHDTVGKKAATHLKRRLPPPDEPRLGMPQWALDRATELAREMAANIGASGARVVGNLDILAEPRVGRPPESLLPDVSVPPEVCALLAMGMLHATGAAASDARAHSAPVAAEPIELVCVPTSQLGVTLARRTCTATARWVRRALARPPS